MPFKRIFSVDENVEEILHLVRNQEKDTNEDIMYENIVLKKAFRKPLDAPLPAIPPTVSHAGFKRKKSNSCSETTGARSWNCRGRTGSPDVFLDASDDEFLFSRNVQGRRARATSLPPIGCEQSSCQRPKCPTPTQKR